MTNTRSAEVFERLSRGGFVCSNSLRVEDRDLYVFIEEHEERLRELYEEIGYQLEAGNNYYYFSRVNETIQSRERKIERALRWLDILAFFTTYRKDLCRGARLLPHHIAGQLDLNNSLKEQLIALSKTKEKKSYQEQLDALFRELKTEGFIDLENEMSQTWKILDAWDYMERMVMAVNVFDDEETDS